MHNASFHLLLFFSLHFTFPISLSLTVGMSLPHPYIPMSLPVPDTQYTVELSNEGLY